MTDEASVRLSHRKQFEGESVDRTTGTSKITETQVRDWARQAISGWFTGRDEGFDERAFQAYEIAKHNDGSYTFFAPDGSYRRFDIAVVVVAL